MKIGDKVNIGNALIDYDCKQSIQVREGWFGTVIARADDQDGWYVLFWEDVPIGEVHEVDTSKCHYIKEKDLKIAAFGLYNQVKVLRDKEEYNKNGVFAGMVGTTIENWISDWEVSFSCGEYGMVGEHWEGYEVICVIKGEDLQAARACEPDVNNPIRQKRMSKEQIAKQEQGWF